jgi:hypothetical protein
MFWPPQNAHRQVMIGSTAQPFLPWFLITLAASERFFRFVRTMLARDFTHLVQLLQSTSPSPERSFSPIDHSVFAPDSFFRILRFITVNSSLDIQG